MDVSYSKKKWGYSKEGWNRIGKYENFGFG